MTLSFEAMLILGVVGFYLLDSAMLLYVNELVFSKTSSKWIFTSPESLWQMLGKNLFLPNPLSPDRALFRVCWAASAPNECQQDHEALQNFIHALNPLRYMTDGLFVMLLIGLPLVLFIFGSGLVLLALFGAIYLTISAMLIQIFRQREELGLTDKTVAKLAFDSLACAPHALNLVRKITLHRSLVGDPIGFAHQNFDAATFARLVHVLCHRIDEEIEFQDEASARYSTLKDYQNRIRGMAS